MSHVTEDLSHIGGKFVSILMLFGVHRSVKVTDNLESMNNEHFRNNFSQFKSYPGRSDLILEETIPS